MYPSAIVRNCRSTSLALVFGQFTISSKRHSFFFIPCVEPSTEKRNPPLSDRSTDLEPSCSSSTILDPCCCLTTISAVHMTYSFITNEQTNPTTCYKYCVSGLTRKYRLNISFRQKY